jgi:hypothetical protein
MALYFDYILHRWKCTCEHYQFFKKCDHLDAIEKIKSSVNKRKLRRSS